jgi:hypothetical protein
MCKRNVADSYRGCSSQRIKRRNLKFGVNTHFRSIGKYKHSYQSTRNNNIKDFSIYQDHSNISLICAECDVFLPLSGPSSIPRRYIPFPFILFYQLFFHPPSLQLTICFLVYLSALLFPNSYIIFFGNYIFFHSLYMPKPT